MKVLLISHTCQSKTEGQPKAHALAKIPGVDLKVIVPRKWKHYGKWRAADVPNGASFDLTVERARWPWVGPAQNYLHWYPGLKQILREFQPDVIDLWEEPWGLVSAHACKLRDRIVPTAKIVSETEQNLNKKLPPPFESLRRYVLGKADFVVGRNSDSLEVVRTKGYRGPATVVPNAVDAELFRPMNRSQCREELGVSGFVLGYAGRLVKEKGILDLLNALRQVDRSVNLLIVGGGPLEAEIREQIQSPDLAGRVRLLGPQPLEKLPLIFNALDVFVLPSRTTPRWKEQFGRVIIEAQACGIPVIGSDSGAIPDVVADGGLIFREQSPADLAKAVVELFNSPERMKTLGEIGRERVLKECTWEKVAEQMHDIYRSVLGKMPVAV